MPVEITKQQLRQRFLAARRAMPPDVATRKSMELAGQVISLVDWASVHTMHCFLPLVGENEPDMRQVIEFALARGITVYTSDPFELHGRPAMRVESDDIRQFSLADPIQFNLIILPMIAYDPTTNHRIGFGGGFYDRFLANQTGAQKVGVCFSEYAATFLAEPHDQPLDVVLVA